jgi:hypothetical protein
VREIPHLVGEADKLENVRDIATNVIIATTRHFHRKGDVLIGVLCRQEAEVLEDGADVAAQLAEDEQETLLRRAATWKALAKKLWRMRNWDPDNLQLVRVNRLERDLSTTAQGADNWQQDYLTANGERLRLEEECERLEEELEDAKLDFEELNRWIRMKPVEKPSLRERAIEGALDFLTRVLK